MTKKLNIGIYRSPEDDLYRNYEERDKESIIDTIVIHYTVGNFRSSYLELIKPRNISVHYLIDKDGRIDNLVANEKIAWHTGKSYWNGKEAVNNFSIGIELVNSGSDQKTEDGKLKWKKKDFFPQAQMTALANLIGYLKTEIPTIKDRNIIGHSDITADDGRKLDPGICFDWKWLKNQGYGLYASCDTSLLQPEIFYSYGESGPKIEDLQQKLAKYGYKINITGEFDDVTRNVVRAFNMHFHNDIIFDYEIWDNISDIVLNNLLDTINTEN